MGGRGGKSGMGAGGGIGGEIQELKWKLANELDGSGAPGEVALKGKAKNLYDMAKSDASNSEKPDFGNASKKTLESIDKKIDSDIYKYKKDMRESKYESRAVIDRKWYSPKVSESARSAEIQKKAMEQYKKDMRGAESMKREIRNSKNWKSVKTTSTKKSKPTKSANRYSGKPKGMSEKVYKQYKKDGMSDKRIHEVYKDTLKMRKQMRANAERIKKEGKREITSSAYKRSVSRNKKKVDDWFGLNRR